MKKPKAVLSFLILPVVLVFSCSVFAEQSNYKQVRGKDGFWRVVQDGEGVWWFLSPAGKLEFLNTVTNVQPFQKGRDKNGPHYVSPDWKGGIGSEVWDTAIEDADKNLEQWAARTVGRVEEAGFKGLGGWCNRVLHKYNVTISRVLNVWSRVGGNKLFYDPDWSRTAEEAIKNQVLPLRENKNLVGYFIDNELGWKGGFGWPGRYFDESPTGRGSDICGT
jgi:hypothetical protein